jgi:hypothetical protein
LRERVVGVTEETDQVVFYGENVPRDQVAN